MLPLTRTDVYDNDKTKRHHDNDSLVLSVARRLQKRWYLVVTVLVVVAFLSLPSAQQPAPTKEFATNEYATKEQATNEQVTKEQAIDEFATDESTTRPSPTEYVMRHPPTRDPKFPRMPVGKIVQDPVWYDRQEDVRASFKHAWDGYRNYAFGQDELLPLSKRGHDWFGIGLTILDSLDTMWTMGYVDEFHQSVQWIKSSLKFNRPEAVNFFEVTIRALGGLLSAYYQSNVPELLETAVDLGDRLMAAFDSPTPIPYSDVYLATKRGAPAGNNGGVSSTAEVATVQLEFAFLSHLTKDPRFVDKADGVIKHIRTLRRPHGLVPIYISPTTGSFSSGEIRLGSRGDSYYEYLVKRWLQGGCQDAELREMYDEAMDGVASQLVRTSKPNGLTLVAELQSGVGGPLTPKMDHLVCFLPGTLALGATRGRPLSQLRELTSRQKRDLELAANLTHTCMQMYKRMATGLAPEIVYFNTAEGSTEDMRVNPQDRHNLLRPETVESLFIMYRITGDIKYREWGWDMYQAFEKYTRVETGGYACLNDVTAIPPPKRDKMESFFLAETLKYFYLLFGTNDTLPLDRYVFNTEAHALPILHSTC